MVKIGDRVQIYETCSNYYGRCGIVIGDDFCPTFPYKVEFEDGDDCIFKGKDLIVLSTEEETTMLFEVGDEVRVRQPTNLFHSELGKVVSIDHVNLMYKVIFHRGDSDVYTCFDLILVKRQEETSMKFKVGDRVQVVAQYSAFYGDKGTVTENDGTDNLPIHVNFDVDGHVCRFYENDLKVLHEEEKVMKFKVGDKVRMTRNTYGNRGKIGTLEKIDTSTMPYFVVFDDGRKEWCYGNEFKLLREETSMKFKVGDRVKVKDSWFGHDGQVGVVLDIDNYGPYNYNIKFDTEGYNERRDEKFKGDSLELAKQQFTKSDLKTGMGVVLRNGDKAHVMLGTDDGDVMRFLEKDTWDTLKSANEDLTWKGSDKFDIVEVYSAKLASRYLTDKVFDGKLVFKREEPEPTKMTMKEINEHFGKAIEIVE